MHKYYANSLIYIFQIIDSEMSLIVKNSSDSTCFLIKSSTIPHLKAKCFHNHRDIGQLLKASLTQVANLPVQLEEPAIFAYSNTGPWKVSFPMKSKTYYIHQDLEQRKKFGQVMQTFVNSNEHGIGYITVNFGNARKSKKINVKATIAKCDLVQHMELKVCHGKFDLIALKDSVHRLRLPKNELVCFSVNIDAKGAPKCQTESHAANIVSSLPDFSINYKNRLSKYVLRPNLTLKMTFKPTENTGQTKIVIEKGQKIAYAECCHGHYEDSLTYQ